jgi:glutamate-1-semialdehyde 2,1-aminomutase
MTMSYAISHWPDTDALLAKAKRLVTDPPRPIRRDKMQECLAYFETRCPRSKASTAAAALFIPGGVQHNLAFNYPFPLDIARAQGAYLWDVDGNRYVDFLQAGGPTVLGSNYGPVRAKVIDVLHACGPVTGLFHEYEYKLAELINRHMPHVEMFRMLGSGSEACMAAIRAARNFTGRSKIIKVGGAYHGWSDQLVLGTRIPGSGAFEAAGIPASALQHTQEFYPNDIDGENGLRALLERNTADGGTAAVIVEPLGPESGSRPVQRDFNARVRALCDEYGALLIFDEVVTGFRLGLGGAQGYFDIKPDLTVFGKCIAGGYPAAGGVGGRRDIMSTFAAGIGGGQQKTLVGGTLSANPISAAAGYFATLEMERTNAPVTSCARVCKPSLTNWACPSLPTTTARSCISRRTACCSSTSATRSSFPNCCNAGRSPRRWARRTAPQASSRWPAAACTPAWRTPTRCSRRRSPASGTCWRVSRAQGRGASSPRRPHPWLGGGRGILLLPLLAQEEGWGEVMIWFPDL